MLNYPFSFLLVKLLDTTLDPLMVGTYPIEGHYFILPHLWRFRPLILDSLWRVPQIMVLNINIFRYIIRSMIPWPLIISHIIPFLKVKSYRAIPTWSFELTSILNWINVNTWCLMFVERQKHMLHPMRVNLKKMSLSTKLQNL